MNDTALRDALSELVRLQYQYRPDPTPHEWTYAWDAAEKALASTPAQAEPAVLPSEAIYGLMGWLTCRDEVMTLSSVHDAAGVADAVVAYCDSQGFKPPRQGIYPANLKPGPRSAPAQAQPDPGVPGLLAEIERLRSDRDCEKRLRKDAEDRREELLEAQAVAPLTDAQIADAMRQGLPGTKLSRGYVVFARAIEAAHGIAAAPTAPERPTMLSELLKDWSEARAVDGIKHPECMRMVQVGDRMLDALQRFAPPEQPEARLNEDGTLDEVVGIGAFHLEQMADDHWWMEIENSAGRIAVWLITEGGKIVATYEAEPAEPAAPAQPVKGELCARSSR